MSLHKMLTEHYLVVNFIVPSNYDIKSFNYYWDLYEKDHDPCLSYYYCMLLGFWKLKKIIFLNVTCFTEWKTNDQTS